MSLYEEATTRRSAPWTRLGTPLNEPRWLWPLTWIGTEPTKTHAQKASGLPDALKQAPGHRQEL